MSAITEASPCLMRTGAAAQAAGRSGQAGSKRPTPGSLLAVCGLAGGAGTTTLVYLVALAAARELDEPVLVADTGGPSGALAARAGVEAPRSLAELGSHLAAGLPVGDGIYACGPAGLRVLAAAPEFSTSSPGAQLNRILDDACEAHRLTVIDCGTLSRDVDRAVAAASTRLAWVTAATSSAVSRAWRVLSAAPLHGARELLVARHDARQPKAPVKELRRLAAVRHAPLVLVPNIDSRERGSAERALEEAQPAIQAILGAALR